MSQQNHKQKYKEVTRTMLLGAGLGILWSPTDHFTAGFVYLLLTSLQIILRQN